jgi:hypothetical protein
MLRLKGFVLDLFPLHLVPKGHVSGPTPSAAVLIRNDDRPMGRRSWRHEPRTGWTPSFVRTGAVPGRELSESPGLASLVEHGLVFRIFEIVYRTLVEVLERLPGRRAAEKREDGRTHERRLLDEHRRRVPSTGRQKKFEEESRAWRNPRQGSRVDNPRPA